MGLKNLRLAAYSTLAYSNTQLRTRSPEMFSLGDRV
jgi:hypothetical protein